MAAQHFPVWKDIMAAILKFLHQIENPTPSVDAYWREGVLGFFVKWRRIQVRLPQSMRFHLRDNPAKSRQDQIWNDGALGFFEEVAATARTTKIKMSSDRIGDQFLIEKCKF